MNQIEINKIENMWQIKTFEEWLQDYFIGLREVGGIPIIKDNCEDLFEHWLSNKDVAEMIELGENYGLSISSQMKELKEKISKLEI